MTIINYLTIPYEKMNCYQLARHIYKNEFNIDLVDMSQIKDDETRKIHKEILRQSIEWKVSNIPHLYDFVLMNNDDHHSIINHIGIYIGDGKVIHTSKKTGCVISKIDMLNIKGYATHPKML